jgi:PPIC-type PPIASE domain
MTMKRWLKEPLLHFLVLGALLFGVYAWMNRGEQPQTGQIVVTKGQIENLRVTFNRVWQHPPSPSEMDGLIRDHIREEVLAREATKLGLDLDDTVIRRRLRQKMEFVASDLAVPPVPTEAELKEFLVKHTDFFRVEPRLTVRQVYLNPAKRGDALQGDAARLIAELNRPRATADFRTLGDATMLSSELTDVPVSEVVRDFGEDFAKQVENLPDGRWQGPVTSTYGVHLVLVAQKTPGRMPALAEVYDQVAREWTDAKRREENETFYQKLLKRYVVTIEGEPSVARGQALASEVK